MPKTQLPITGGFYQNRSLPISDQQCINWYVNVNQGRALSDESLFGTPGITQLATSGVITNDVYQVNRGSYTLKQIPYFVNGETLYRLESDLTLTTLGTIPGDQRVAMAENGVQLFILIPGGNGYIFTTDPDTLTQITDPNFTASGNSRSVVYIDGYFTLSTDQDKIIVSALNNGLAYNALDFASAEVDPDGLVTLVVFNNQLFALGRETIEVFQNIGGAAFPFQRVQGFVIAKGCFAQFSAIDTPDTFYFIGGGKNESPSIYALNGQNAQAISTDGIDGILQDFSEDDLSNAFAWQYSQAGARFVGFTFPETTLVYDVVAQRWHERRSQIIGQTGVQDIRWRANSLITAYNRVLVGDSQDGRIGEVSLDYYDEYGSEIIRELATAPFSNQGNSVFVPNLELTMEAGVGDFETRDPQIRLSISKNGKTYKDELSRNMGRVGEYEKRTIWRRLGRFSRFVVFKFKMSDKVKPVIIKLEADMQGGSK